MAKKKARGKTDAPTERTFEQAMDDLEKIVGRLEEGQLSLDQALAEYERGAGCLQQCYRQLREAEQRIVLVRAVDEQGEVQGEPFGDADLSLEQKQAARGRRRSRPAAEHQSAGDEPEPPMDHSGNLF